MALDIPKIVELLGGTAVALVSSFFLWMIGHMSSEDNFIVIWLIVVAIISIWLGWFLMILRSLR